MIRTLRHFFEFIGVALLMTPCRVLPADRASAFGGWIGRKIGPATGIHRKARRQIQKILPDLTDDATEKILRDMWDNLGRTMGEYPHLETLARTRVTLHGAENLPSAPGAVIFISGHFANWEMGATTLAVQRNITPALIYRPPNNPFVDRLLNRWRSLNGVLQTLPKSRTGVRAMIATLQAGRPLGILIDQKYNEGVAVPFFGHPAMTSTTFADLAHKFSCPVVPVQVMRTAGAHFTVTVHPPLDAALPPQDMAHAANNLLGVWMREAPAQWLWVHQRWPKD